MNILLGAQSNTAILDEIRHIAHLLSAEGPAVHEGAAQIEYIPWKPTLLSQSICAGLPNVVGRILLDAVEKSEKRVPGSGALCLELSVTAVLSCMQRVCAQDAPTIILNELQDDLRALEKIALGNTEDLTGEKLQSLMVELSDHPRAATLAQVAVVQGGVAAKFNVVQGSAQSSVQIRKGYTFTAQSVDVTENPVWDRSDVKVMLVDGIVERFSEINTLVDVCRENATALLVLARGFSEEVIGTIGTNNRLGTIDVKLLKVPFDMVGANQLKDVAVAVDSDVISSLQGQLISAVKFDQVVSCKHVATSAGKVTFNPSIVSRGLSAHVKQLHNARAGHTGPTNVDLRIQSLTSESVKVVVEDTIPCGPFEVEQLLRTSHAFLRAGSVDLEKVLEKYAGVFTHTKTANFRSHIPLASLLVAIQCTGAVCQALCNLGGVFTLE